MKKTLSFLVSACLVATSPFASAAPSAKQLRTIGNWTIYLNQDDMTDKRSCMAFYSGPGGGLRTDIALFQDALLFNRSRHGGVWNYQVRFDDTIADSERGMADDDRIKGNVWLRGGDYETLLHSKRLRARFANVSGNVTAEDLDLSGLGQAREFFDGPQCN
ncbi:hypothetical protein [Burkholderia pseudomallei]|uniref:hypothetical protein n=1 Tax=Burkholderia pseudomallei TaxID=28450 RepID=UPI000AC7BCBB|nr:hypothetical protein [Burkholderia pseudomallei]